MKITKISYQNFRNFKDEGSVTFDIDGKVNIIYGKNGDGKTTFHQLFRWVFYGDVRFNQTATSKIYNLETEKTTKPTDKWPFSVWGKIEFVHEGTKYFAYRKWEYKKILNGQTKRVSDIFHVGYMDKNNSFKRLNNPDQFIQQVLPQGLSDYFFFDGETMVADLKQKGKDSAKLLKQALYLILNLNIYSSAVESIGNIDKITTVLGKLIREKAEICSDPTIADSLDQNQQILHQSETAQKKLDEKIKSNNSLINEISSKIGSNSLIQSQYENNRKLLFEKRDLFAEKAKESYIEFGHYMSEEMPKIFLSATIEKVSNILERKSKSPRLFQNLSLPLIESILKNKVCICGNKLTNSEIESLNKLAEMLPPKGYDYLYNAFLAETCAWGRNYRINDIEDIIAKTTEALAGIKKTEKDIHALEEEMRENKIIEPLIIQRNLAQEENNDLEQQRDECLRKITIADARIKNLEKKISKFQKDTADNAIIDEKIEIMKEVQKRFSDLLSNKSHEYSQKLENSIQNLLDSILTAKREVSISDDFVITVKDQFGDESKSEGQFAAVTFAYIGGIFKVLSDEPTLSGKEFPLVLDAPFSKLDDEQRKNVVNEIPKYAPQIIIFSKDDLSDEFKNNIGRVYTIQSNEFKNAAEIKEGMLWKRQ